MKMLNKLYDYYRRYDESKDPKRFLLFMGVLVPLVCFIASDSIILFTIGMILILFFGITRVTYLRGK